MVRNVSVQTDEEVVDSLDALVDDSDEWRSRSDAIRVAIDEFLDSHDGQD